jgi:Fe-S cluster assembly protein SufD
VTKQSFFKSLLAVRSDITNTDSLPSKIRTLEMARLMAIDQPDTNDEEWRFTNLKPLYRTEFGHVTSVDVQDLVDSAELPESVGARIVFVNGQIDESLTDVSNVASAARIIRFSSANADDTTAIIDHLNAHMSLDQDAFLALNGSLLTDGVWIDLPKNVVVDAPIHILFLNSSCTPCGKCTSCTGYGRYAR